MAGENCSRHGVDDLMVHPAAWPCQEKMAKKSTPIDHYPGGRACPSSAKK
jgi:hypothetical protein